jgi:hypothetical protein
MNRVAFRVALIATAVGSLFAMSSVYAYRRLADGSQESAANGRMPQLAVPEIWWEGIRAVGPSTRCKGCHARD